MSNEEAAAQAGTTMRRLATGGAVLMSGFGDPTAVTLPAIAGTLQRDPARFYGHGDASLLITPGALG